jgi:hypothetical protein
MHKNGKATRAGLADFSATVSASPAVVATDCFPDERSYRRALRFGRAVVANILWGVDHHAAYVGITSRGSQRRFGDWSSFCSLGSAGGRWDHVVLVPDYQRWANHIDELGRCIDGIRVGSKTSVTLIDIADQPASPYLELLPKLERLLKGQLSRDRSLYHASPCAGAAFATWCLTTYGWTGGPHAFQSAADPAQLEKLQVGWTFGFVPFFTRLAMATRIIARPFGRRRTHLHARFSPAPLGRAGSSDYYTRYRSYSAAAVKALPSRIRATSPALVNRWQFYRELFDSQIVFSPFGWGEVCFRDYEAAAAGCVLLKPSMAHIETRPAIYHEYETYVPVRWDLADLEDKIDWVLANPCRAGEIAANLNSLYLQEIRHPALPSNLTAVSLRSG